MFHLATSDLLHLLTTYGYWAVLVFVAIESIGRITIVLAVLLILVLLVVVRRNEHRLEEEAERALPVSLDAY